MRLMTSFFGLCLMLSAALLAGGCGSDGSNDTPGNNSSPISGGSSAPKVPVAESRAGTSYRQEITAPNGDILVVQVFEPSELEAGRSYPLVLQGHGYGGTRYQEANDFIQRLNDSGYYVISIDERGFGESSGTVRVMSPDFEGQSLIALLDWAEDLEGLARRSNGEMYVGSYGGSYGGMYQLLLYAADPEHRLRVMAPDITPHDLTYALNPHDTVKSGWGLALIAGGEVPLLSLASDQDPAAFLEKMGVYLQRGSQRQDVAIFEILLNAAVSNEFSEAGFNFMRYHSMKYYCDGQPAGPQDFMFADPDPMLVAPDAPPAADVLVTQGMLDTLFNFNDGAGNYECLKRFGGDVRLLTHQSGHILPVSLDTAGLEDPLDPFYQALTLPEFQESGASRNCGSLVLDEVQFAWFEEKLRGQDGAVDAALVSGRNVCMSLAEDDAVAVRAIKRGGEAFAIEAGTPQLNSVLGLVGSLLGTQVREAMLANIPLYVTPEGGRVIAGIPTLNVELSGLSGVEMEECPAPMLQTGCDPILFLAIGHRPAGQSRWEPLDDQITPIRGFGQHSIEMNGIAERLAEGDELALLIYGFHAQFPVTWSRDIFVPAVNFSGELQLPLLNSGDIVIDGL